MSQVPVNHDATLPQRVLVTADEPDHAIGGYSQHTSRLRFHCCCCPTEVVVRYDCTTGILADALSETNRAREVFPGALNDSVVSAVTKASRDAQENLPCGGVLLALLTLCSGQVPLVTVPQALMPPRIAQPRSTGSGVASFGSWVQAIRVPSLVSTHQQTSLQACVAMWDAFSSGPYNPNLKAVMLRNVIFWQIPGSSHGIITMMQEQVNFHRTTVFHSECKHLQPEDHGFFCPRSLQVFLDLLRGQTDVEVCVCL